MTDIVKELYKGEVLFGNYTSGTQTLYATDSTKTAVIKEVELISTTYATAPTLQVSDVNVVPLSGNATGSEILGINNSINIKNNQSASGYSLVTAKYLLDYTAATPQFFAATNPASIFSPTTPAISVTKGTATTIAGSALSGGTQIYWTYLVGSNLYYFSWDGNSTTNFYYRNISTGAQTTISSSNYTPVCFNGVDKFYYVNQSGQLYAFDTNTMSSNMIYGSMGAGSSYPNIWFANNVIFWRTDYNQTTMKIYNLTNSTYTTMPDASWYSSDGTWTSIYYDAANLNYRLIANGTNMQSTFKYIDISVNAAGTTFTRTNQSTFTTTINGTGKAVRTQQQTVAGLYNYHFGSSQDGVNNVIYRSDKFGTLIQVGIISDQTFNPIYTSGFANVTAATNSDLNTYGPKINLRITGVESTL